MIAFIRNLFKRQPKEVEPVVYRLRLSPTSRYIIAFEGARMSASELAKYHALFQEVLKGTRDLLVINSECKIKFFEIDSSEGRGM